MSYCAIRFLMKWLATQTPCCEALSDIRFEFLLVVVFVAIIPSTSISSATLDIAVSCSKLSSGLIFNRTGISAPD